jgi:hypothetical protein
MATKKPTTATLYELTEEQQTIMDDMAMWAEDNDGDVTDYPVERLEKLEGDIKSKVLKCAVMYKEWKSQGAAIKAEEQNLAKRRKVHEGRGDRIKSYMESCLPQNAKFEDSRASVSWKNNPAAVELLVPVETLPELYIRRAEPEADKGELKARMQVYEVPLLDGLGAPVFDGETPVMTTVAQVRWPKPVADDVPFAEAPADPNAPDYIILARLTQGRSLMIK